PRLVKTVSEALRLPYVAVGLMWPDGVEEAARHGTLVGTPLILPLTNHGELIGQLIVGERTPGEGSGSGTPTPCAASRARSGLRSTGHGSRLSCSAHESGWSSLGRRNAGASSATCTTVWGRRWR